MSPAPANRHLDWLEVKDFSPGLWEVGEWLIPAGGAQELTDAYPQPAGGLRAFFKPTTLAATGIGANERIIGFYGHGAPHRTLATEGVDYYCVTYNSVDFRPRIYRWDQTDVNETQWRLMAALAAATGSNNRPKSAHFTAYVLTNGTVRILAAIGYITAADSGIWAANQASAGAAQTWAKIATTDGLGSMAIHQSRLLESRGAKVHYTGAGNETFAGFVNIEPQRNLSDIQALIPMAPGDLTIGTDGTSWASIQGDITDPVVRTMSSGHSLGTYDQAVVDTGLGLAFMEDGGGTYLTDGGSSFERIDTQLNPPVPAAGDMVSMGFLVHHRHWLFAPRGYIWDQRTKAWFKSSALSGANKSAIQAADRRADKVFSVLAGTTTIYSYGVREGESPRANNYSWKSPPLRSDDGRQVEVREVQLVLSSYNTNLSTVTVTVNGTSRGSGVLGLGRHAVSIPFRERAEVLDVRVVADSGDTANEAPSIEVVRIGHRSGHRVA